MQHWLSSVAHADIPVQPEPEYGAGDEGLLCHALEHRHYPIHRDGGEGHPQDPVKLGSNEGDAGLLGGLGKELVFHCDITHLKEWVCVKEDIGGISTYYCNYNYHL